MKNKDRNNILISLYKMICYNLNVTQLDKYELFYVITSNSTQCY